MPRVNPNRSTAHEQNLARRITHEREARGMSLDGTARRMTDRGLPMQKTTIFKIESGARRITVDELVAFSDVFELDVVELLIPVELVEDREAKNILDDQAHLVNELHTVAGRLFTAFSAYRTYLAADPEREHRIARVLMGQAVVQLKGRDGKAKVSSGRRKRSKVEEAVDALIDQMDSIAIDEANN